MTAFEESTFVSRIKSYNTMDAIIKSIMLWTKNKELIGRRSNEARLYKDGNYNIDKTLNWGKV
jgi:GH24 family phage-related lysozyme (muramidase)